MAGKKTKVRGERVHYVIFTWAEDKEKFALDPPSRVVSFFLSASEISPL
jgi:hypothetical protein